MSKFTLFFFGKISKRYWLAHLPAVSETACLGQSEMVSYSSILISYSTALKLPFQRSSYKDHFIFSAKEWAGESAAKTCSAGDDGLVFLQANQPERLFKSWHQDFFSFLKILTIMNEAC